MRNFESLWSNASICSYARGLLLSEVLSILLIREWSERKNTELTKIAKVEPTTKCKHSAVASGATPIGSAGRAPDEIWERRKIGVSRQYTATIERSFVVHFRVIHNLLCTPIGRSRYCHQTTRRNSQFQQPTKALDNIFSERVRRGKNSECRDSKKSAKVRPQDPSCVAWHRTRMRSPTLSASTDAKKNPDGRVRYSIK